MADLGDVLRRLESLESAMAAFYEWCAGALSRDAEAAALFSRLAEEEMQHADLARFQRNIVARNRSLFRDVPVDLEEIETVRGAVDVFRKAYPAPTLQEIVIFALRQERTAAEHHTQRAMADSNPGMADFIRALARADRTHLDILRDLAARRGLTLPPDLQRP